MSSEALIVEVLDTAENLRHEYRFSRSPVRLGRSPLNDLPLAREFVSHCHGVMHFDDRQCHFMDLGSLNGTYLGEQRLAANQQIAVAPGSCLSIGTLELRVRRAPANDEMRNTYAFKASGLDAPVVEPSPPPSRATPQSVREETAATEELTRLYRSYRAVWRDLLEASTRQVAHSADRDRAVSELLSSFPELAQEAEFRRWLGTDRPANSLTPPRLDDTAGQATSASSEPRAARVLERFALSFIELRRGQAQFAREISVGTPSSDAISRIDDARALVSYLLDPITGTSKLDELSRAYADIMVHQVALLSGLRAAANQLLEELSPEGISATLSGPKAFLLRFFGRDLRWERFCRRFHDLNEESALSEVLLGRGFARAYAMAMGQRDPARSSAKKASPP